MIRVLVVDDSGFMRVAIRKMIETESDISVIGEARDGSAAIQLVKDLDPDIITMDVEMAGMDGITAARTIMQQCPRPIIMVSSITQTGASATVEALKAGAVDFISKSSSFVSLDIVKIEKELKEKIRVHARKAGVLGTRPAARPMAFATPSQNPVPRPAVLPAAMTRTPSDLVVIGVSTGGPRMLPDMLKAMGVPRQPVVVAQHMPPLFTKSFADHLTQDTGIPVFEGVDGCEAKPGTVLIL
ncbi:MAG: response regulator, partial [Rhodospirillales bacterium]|nr:response regulator [Rhodospirillales bacterium]